VHFVISPNGVLKVAEDDDPRLGLYGLAIFVLFDCLEVHGWDDEIWEYFIWYSLKVIAESAIFFGIRVEPDLIVGVRPLYGLFEGGRNLLDEHENSNKENPRNREPGCIYRLNMRIGRVAHFSFITQVDRQLCIVN
jgi:hypothetical protein